MSTLVNNNEYQFYYLEIDEQIGYFYICITKLYYYEKLHKNNKKKQPRMFIAVYYQIACQKLIVSII